MASGKNNLRGDIIKILLTTKTGAEGIDLKNVRQVHIVEPFGILLEQNKLKEEQFVLVPIYNYQKR